MLLILGWQTKLTKDLSFEQFIHFPLTRHNIKFLQALPGSEDALYSAIPSLLSLLIIVRFLLEYLKHPVYRDTKTFATVAKKGFVS